MFTATLLSVLVASSSPDVGEARNGKRTWYEVSSSLSQEVSILWESITPIGPVTRIAWFRIDPQKADGYDYYLEQDLIDCARSTFTVLTLVDYRTGQGPPLKTTILSVGEQKAVLTRPGTVGGDMVKAACDGRPR